MTFMTWSDLKGTSHGIIFLTGFNVHRYKLFCPATDDFSCNNTGKTENTIAAQAGLES